jgi:hypothetical protein
MNIMLDLDSFSLLIDSFNAVVGLCGAILIPITLALIAQYWPAIQSRARQQSFQALILRELEEITPHPEEPSREGWWQHQEKNFVHQKILNDVANNRDFILSLDPDLVYYVTQLWDSIKADEPNWSQWDYYLKCLSDPKYDRKGKITAARKKWIALYKAYQEKE